MRRTARVLAAVAATGALLLAAAGCGGTGSASGAAGARTVTVYSVDGLADWYHTQFAAFTERTGIKVAYVEAGSGEVVSRLAKERSNPQADVAMTLPPFVQQAAQQGLLAPYTPAGADRVPAAERDPRHRFTAFMNNYLCFIDNPTAAKPAPKTYRDLLSPRFRGKLQYSTPGQAGDGTAVLLQLQHVYGAQGALTYLARLEANNVGQSSSTGKLQPKVSKGELAVANGDVQMNLLSRHTDGSTFDIFFPADDAGTRSTLPIPYYTGLVTHAPHAGNGRKLIDFLLSRGVQQTIPAQAMGLPARQDVHPTDANYREFTALLTGVTVWNPDWDAVSKRLSADVAAYSRAVGRS